jgi:hypothetical protein
MSVVEAGLPLEESELVFRWRLFQSLRMGFATGLAERIAAADVDLHELEDLIGRGCPRGTAYRILRPWRRFRRASRLEGVAARGGDEIRTALILALAGYA